MRMSYAIERGRARAAGRLFGFEGHIFEQRSHDERPHATVAGMALLGRGAFEVYPVRDLYDHEVHALARPLFARWWSREQWGELIERCDMNGESIESFVADLKRRGL